MREHYIIDSNIKYQIKDDPESELNYHLVSQEKTKPEYNIRMIEGKLYYLYRVDQPPRIEDYLCRSMFDCGYNYVDHFKPIFKHKDRDSKIVGYLHSVEMEPTPEEQRRNHQRRKYEEKQTLICKWIPITPEHVSHAMSEI